MCTTYSIMSFPELVPENNLKKNQCRAITSIQQQALGSACNILFIAIIYNAILFSGSCVTCNGKSAEAPISPPDIVHIIMY